MESRSGVWAAKHVDSAHSQACGQQLIQYPSPSNCLPHGWASPYNAINRLINSPNFPWLPLKPGPPTVEVISPLDPTLHAPKKLRRRSWCLTPELQRSACSNRIPLRQLAPVMLVWSCLAQICHWWDMNRGDCWSAREQMNSNNQQ